MAFLHFCFSASSIIVLAFPSPFELYNQHLHLCVIKDTFFPYNLKLVLKKRNCLIYCGYESEKHNIRHGLLKWNSVAHLQQQRQCRYWLSFDTCHRHRCSLQQKVIYKPDNLKVFFIFYLNEWTPNVRLYGITVFTGAFKLKSICLYVLWVFIFHQFLTVSL